MYILVRSLKCLLELPYVWPDTFLAVMHNFSFYYLQEMTLQAMFSKHNSTSISNLKTQPNCKTPVQNVFGMIFGFVGKDISEKSRRISLQPPLTTWNNKLGPGERSDCRSDVCVHSINWHLILSLESSIALNSPKKAPSCKQNKEINNS